MDSKTKDSTYVKAEPIGAVRPYDKDGIVDNPRRIYAGGGEGGRNGGGSQSGSDDHSEDKVVR